jgi:hypothetical protein
MSSPAPSYSTVEAALERLGADVSPAEGHGLLCALLCADPGAAHARWVGELLSAADVASLPAETSLVLDRLQAATGLQLSGPDSDLELLLPDDDAPLGLRAEALAEWCGAFLYGLGLAGVQEGGATSTEVGEVLQDLAEISRLEPDGEGQEDERALLEVSEFVRVAVMLVYEALQALDPTDGPPRVH